MFECMYLNTDKGVGYPPPVNLGSPTGGKVGMGEDFYMCLYLTCYNKCVLFLQLNFNKPREEDMASRKERLPAVRAVKGSPRTIAEHQPLETNQCPLEEEERLLEGGLGEEKRMNGGREGESDSQSMIRANAEGEKRQLETPRT